MKVKQFVCDEIVDMSFGRGLIRMDIGTVGSIAQDGAEPTIDKVARLNFTPESFIQFAGAVQGMMDKLVEAGVLIKNEEPGAGTPPPSLSS